MDTHLIRRQDFHAWVLMWPEHCRSCGATGRNTKHEPCPGCMGASHCPRCAAEGTIQDGVCSACGWDGSDTAYQMFRCTLEGCTFGPHGEPGYAPARYGKSNRFCTPWCYHRAPRPSVTADVRQAIADNNPRRLKPKHCAWKQCSYKMDGQPKGYFLPRHHRQKYCSQQCSGRGRSELFKGKARKKKTAA